MRVQVQFDTLSPAWCESLLFDRVLLEGTKEELQQDPPLIIINIYDYDSMVTPAFFLPMLQIKSLFIFRVGPMRNCWQLQVWRPVTEKRLLTLTHLPQSVARNVKRKSERHHSHYPWWLSDCADGCGSEYPGKHCWQSVFDICCVSIQALHPKDPAFEVFEGESFWETLFTTSAVVKWDGLAFGAFPGCVTRCFTHKSHKFLPPRPGKVTIYAMWGRDG